MSDSIKNKITRAAQVSGYAAGVHGGLANGTTETGYINIPYGAVVTDVNIIITTAFAGGSTTFLVGTGAATVYNQDTGSAQTADPDGFLACVVAAYSGAVVGKKINTTAKTTVSHNNEIVSPAGVLLGTKPPYSLSSTYGSSGEEKVVPVTISHVQASGTSTAGAYIWYVEYMFPANIVWDQASI